MPPVKFNEALVRAQRDDMMDVEDQRKDHPQARYANECPRRSGDVISTVVEVVELAGIAGGTTFSRSIFFLSKWSPTRLLMGRSSYNWSYTYGANE